MRKNIACGSFLLAGFVVLPGAALAITPVNGGPVTLTPVTINASTGDQYDPHVSGEWVSYTSNLTIRYYNFATGIDAEIPLGLSARDLLSDIGGSKIVFSRVITGARTAMMVFDAAAGAAAVEIDPSAGTLRLGAAIGGNTVAYTDFAVDPKGELMIHDLATVSALRVTTDTFFDQNPAVSPDGNVVSWEHCLVSLTNCDVWQAVKTGPLWSVSVVAGSTSPEQNPDTNGTLVVYEASRTAESHILWRPVTGGAEVQLDMMGFQGNPNIARNLIAFESRPTLFDTTDIFIYDLVTNRIYQITNTPLVSEQLNDITVLPDGSVRLVWASDEDGFDQRNIKGATVVLGNIPPMLSLSGDPGYATDGLDPDAGSRPTSFTYKVVYLDANNQAPSSLNVCIDGVCHAMGRDAASTASLQDGGYTNGEQYAFTTGLPAGPHTYHFEASDGIDTTRLPVSGELSGPVVSDLSITTAALPSGSVGLPYSAILTATGGAPPYAWSVGVMPPGLTLDFTTGQISGTPTTPGTHTETFFVADPSGHFDAKVLAIVIIPDTTPPALTVPGNIGLTAISAAGAVLNYSVKAVDAVDPNPTVTCVPPSGTLFPVGTTIVTCTATDFSGNSATAGFKVIIKLKDTTPPVLTVGPLPAVPASSPAGAAVTYTVTATDNIDPHPTLKCVPPPGSTFPIGTTAVTCIATDASGNSAKVSFQIVVVGSEGQLKEIVRRVKTFHLGRGIEESLVAKIQRTLDALAEGGRKGEARACNSLDALVNEARAQSGRALTRAQADQLITMAIQVQAVLGTCGP